MEVTQEAYADELLADAEWLALCEQERGKEWELDKTNQKHLNGTVEVRDCFAILTERMSLPKEQIY